MFIVQLKFSDNKSQAAEYMQAHNRWLQKAFDDGVFLIAGSLQPGIGGGIITANLPRDKIEAVINQDPFVQQAVVEPEITELAVSKTDPRLDFLLN